MIEKKLLVADDSLTIQKVIRLALSNEGFEIQAVSDGNDAVQQISVFRPHVVLIDVSLPGQTAFEVKRAVNQLPDLQGVRFVLMSSAFERVDEAQVSEVGFDGRLTKPFDPAHLREILQQVLEKVSEDAPLSDLPSFESPTFDSPSLSSEEVSEFDQFRYMPGPPDLREPGSELEPEPELERRPEPEMKGPDSDIRELTQQTLRMSGFDQSEWNVQEPSYKSEPTLKPPSRLLDPEGVPDFPPPPSFPPLPQSLGAALVPPPLPASTPRAQTSARAETMAVSSEQIQELIRKQVETTLAEMARKLLPEVAERILKEEIHRLLSESP